MHPLDNPVWTALATHHAAFASGPPRLRRYPAEVAPFLAVPDDAPLLGGGVLAPGEAASIVGVVPSALPPGWAVELDATLLQMVAQGPADVPADGPEVVALGDADVPAMIDLTDRVFPGYFRPRTIAMGRYYGIRAERGLAAMAGERLFADGHREVSGVCTDPSFVGRGYARHLVALLLADAHARGETSFLHVQPGNPGAIRVYERLGFTVRREVALRRVRAPGRG